MLDVAGKRAPAKLRSSRAGAGGPVRPRASSKRRLVHPEHLIYRTAGLPVALRAAARGDDAQEYIISVFRHSFWRLRHLDQWLELISSAASLLVSVPATILIWTARNGPEIRRRHGTAILRQLADQLKLYLTAGVLPPWYYMFELHFEPTRAHALGYLHRFETHGGIYTLLRPVEASPLNDKKAFADHCRQYQVPHVPYLMSIDRGAVHESPLPLAGLFVKPRKGRGGQGAERWDYAGDDRFEKSPTESLSSQQLLERLASMARHHPLLVQPLISNHAAIRDLSSGALSTVRVVTCLDENNDPEFIAAAFRMSVGENRTVDNFHAGGIASYVSDDGSLGPATDAGFDVSLGWLTRHPNTGADIEGRRLPLWPEVKELAARAHRAFDDRKLIGWDIAITDSGPIVVEGNSSPDLDILQRTARKGFANSRLAELIAFHIRARLKGETCAR